MRRAILLLSRFSGWSLSEIKDMDLAELLDWLEEAVQVEKEIGPQV